MTLDTVIRSFRLNWLLVRAALMHDAPTMGLCAVGLWLGPPAGRQVLVAVAFCAVVALARWTAGRRARSRGMTEPQPRRPLSIVLHAGASWAMLRIRSRQSQRGRRMQCVIRVFSAARRDAATVSNEMPKA
jgi:hypothetical protein